MAYIDTLLEDEQHPIDLIESIAENQDWEFDRVGEDQIAMAVEGAWRTYSITVAWCEFDQTLRLIATYDLDAPKDRNGAVYELLNLVNDQCWAGAFTYWESQGLMTYRYGLVLPDGQFPTPCQIDTMITVAVRAAERYYPAVQMAIWSDSTPEESLQVAIAESYGRA
ncbi:MAG: YbjN domain-containing protein [Paracoccaceae bacterium]|jgi:hypothetical protein